MKKLWFPLVFVLAIVLVLFQSVYSEFYTVSEPGYAVMADTVSLLTEEPKKSWAGFDVPLYEFEEDDTVYTQGEKYYMGDDFKEEIDWDFPLFINTGAGLRFTNDDGILFDTVFVQQPSYDTLAIVNGYAYNKNGTRADAGTFLFYKTPNGFFINLKSMTVENGKIKHTIESNSIMVFSDTYMTVLEWNDGQLRYQVVEDLTEHSWVTIDGLAYTYKTIREYLGLISDTDKSALNGEDETETEDLDNATDGTEGLTDEELAKMKAAKKNDGVNEDQDGTGSNSSSSHKSKYGDGAEGGVEESTETVSGQEGKQKGQSTKGVRPDWMRPYYNASGTYTSDIPYQKPEVNLVSIESGVYRLMVNLEIKDDAQRIDKTKRVQVEFYKQLEDGTEELAYRMYAASSRILTAGDGSILPDTTYRVRVHYLYYDEYGVEQAVEVTDNDEIFTTGSISDVGSISLKSGTEGSVHYMDVPIYYDSYLALENVTFDEEESDAEAIYGIDSRSGLLLTITDEATGKTYEKEIETKNISSLKAGKVIGTLQSNSTLPAKTRYTYTITAKDYFGNTLTLLNNSGSFETCKARPTADLKVKTNKLGTVEVSLGFVDTDSTLVDSEDGYPDVYLVFATKEYSKSSDSDQATLWSLTDTYLQNEAAGNGLNNNDTDIVHFAYKLTSDEVNQITTEGNRLSFKEADSASGDTLANLTTKLADNLDLNTKYYMYVLSDYNLNNNKGVVNHGIIGSNTIKTISLASVGDIYVTMKATGVTDDDGVIDPNQMQLTYSLNTLATSSYIRTIVSSINFTISVDKDYTDTASADKRNWALTSSDADLSNFQKFFGYDGTVDASGKPTKTAEALTFMAEELQTYAYYHVTATAKGLYNGKEYDLNVIITGGDFSTTKKDATVELKENSMILVGGLLQFELRVTDIDGAICGDNADYVTLYVYNSYREIVKTEKVQKNTVADGAYQKFTYTGLDQDCTYYILIFADQYSVSSGNPEYNKQLARFESGDALNLSGEIKLKNLVDASNDKFTANYTVSIKDTDYQICPRDAGTTDAKNPYYVTVTKEGEDVTGTYSGSSKVGQDEVKTCLSNNTYLIDGATTSRDVRANVLTQSSALSVDADSKYVFTLYAYIHNTWLELNTLEFTTEGGAIIEISNAQEFATYIKAKGGSGRFCVTADIDFGHLYATAADPNDKSGTVLQTISKVNKLTAGVTQEELNSVPATMNKYALLSQFNGEIDFQGYTFKYDKNIKAWNSTIWGGIFTYLGRSAEIYNVVFDFQLNGNQAMYSNGIFCNYNYGYIHDFYLHYTGGRKLSIYNIGLLAYENCGNGVMSNFVINNDSSDDNVPFAARYNAGLLVSYNAGTIRDGYAYGENIDTTTYYPCSTSVQVGAISGRQAGIGVIENVYSTVNITIYSRYYSSGESTDVSYVGNILGSNSGAVRNCYGIGHATYSEEYVSGTTTTTFNKNAVGPVVGQNNSKVKKVYYYAEDLDGDNTNFKSSASYQKQISKAFLHDAVWQKAVLGSQFDTSFVSMGYYPKVIWPDCMPNQESRALPEQTASDIPEILSAELVDTYTQDDGTTVAGTDEQTYAYLKVRVTNSSHATISGMTIASISSELVGTQETEDNITTFYLRLYHPTKYYSSYSVESINYKQKGSSKTATYTIQPVINVAFYYPVASVSDWTKRLVKCPTENARLMSDLDFSNAASSDIKVASTFSGKLDGNGYTLRNISMQLTNTHSCVFYSVTGDIYDLYVSNLELGQSTKSTSVYGAGFIYSLTGSLDNVHINTEKLTSCGKLGGLVEYSTDGASMENCSVRDITITYREPDNANSTAYVGGLVADCRSSSLSNVYVYNAKITVIDTQTSAGIGGLVGYTEHSGFTTAFTSGSINARAMYVGGLIGRDVQYVDSIRMLNIMTKVNITGSQDCMGGIIGSFYIYDGVPANLRTLSGIALGNVSCTNADCENIGATIGYFETNNVYKGFYCTDLQMITMGSEGAKVLEAADTNSKGFLTTEQLETEATYTNTSGVGMQSGTGTYKYSVATTGYLPTIYYSESKENMPRKNNAGEDWTVKIPIENTNEDSPVVVTNIGKSGTSGIYMDITIPTGYEVSNIIVDDLEYNSTTVDGVKYMNFETNNLTAMTGNAHSSARIVFNYLSEQKHFKDSYTVSWVYIKNTKTGVETKVDISANSVEVPLQLYGNITKLSDWAKYMSADNNYGNYENYKITCAELDFGQGIDYGKNAKIGRLIGACDNTANGTVTIKNIHTTGANNNWIYRLGGELTNINFVDCDVSTTGRNYVGLIGTSSAIISDVDFTNITINEGDTASRNYMGIIGYQAGGSIGSYDENNVDKGKVTLTNIKVGQSGRYLQYVGALVGYASYRTTIDNLDVIGIEVYGQKLLGGLVGATGNCAFSHINLENIIVLGNGTSSGDDFIGGLTGYQSCSTQSGAKGMYIYDVHLRGTTSGDKFTVDDEGKSTDFTSTTVIGLQDSAKANYYHSYIGGLVGYTTAYNIGFKPGFTYGTIENSITYQEDYGNSVDGAIVKTGNYFAGGMFGRSYILANATVTNTYVYTPIDVTAYCYYYYGGVAGYVDSNSVYNTISDSYVVPSNIQQVGICIGSAGWSTYYNTVDSCKLYVRKTYNMSTSYYGGCIGNARGYCYYSYVHNSVVDVTNTNKNYNCYCQAIGGVCGLSSYEIRYCACYGDPPDSSTAAADSKYYIKGQVLVGGISGIHNSGTMMYCYSNSNVISEGYQLAKAVGDNAQGTYVNGTVAGGLIGDYNNTYTYTTAGGKNTYSYANTSCHNNYFAGTVSARSTVGGLIGRVRLAASINNKWTSNVTDREQMGGRTTDATKTTNKVKSGSNNESYYTYANMMLAASLTCTHEGTTGTNYMPYVYAGNVEGFEGKANGYANSSSYGRYYSETAAEASTVNSGTTKTVNRKSADISANYTATRTLLWEGCVLTGLYNGSAYSSTLYNMSANTYVDTANVDSSASCCGSVLAANNDLTKQCESGVAFEQSGKSFTADVRGNTASDYRYQLYNGGYTTYSRTVNKSTTTETTGHGVYYAIQSCTGDTALVATDDIRAYTNLGVRLVSSAQLETFMPYYNMGYLGGFPSVNETDSTANKTTTNNKYWNITGNYTVFFLPNARLWSKGMSLSYYPANSYSYKTEYDSNIKADNQFYIGTSYLPHYRPYNYATGIYSNASIHQQCCEIQAQYHFDIPIPQYTRPATGSSLNLVAASAVSEEDSESEVLYKVYASGPETVNVEFSSAFLDGGSFKLIYADPDYDDNTETLEYTIDKRVYSFHYDYGETLTIEYELDGKTESEEFDESSLLHRAMVYGDYYYYISEDGIVRGDADDSETILSGDFVHLMKGKALDSAGNIWDLTTLSKTGSVAEGISDVDTAIPLQSFTYNGTHLQTYAMMSVTDEGVVRETQTLVGADGTSALLDMTLANRKDTINLYTYDKKQHCMVLGEDGILADLFRKLIVPDDFQNKGIVDMTCNYEASEDAPYVIVTYSNTGMVGFNYETGELLFDNSIASQISLLDYVGVFLTTSQSSLNKVSSTYGSNYSLASSAGSASGLSQIVLGNSADGVTTGNSTDSQTTEAMGNQAKAKGEGEKADGDTALPDLTNQSDGKNSESTEKKSDSTETKSSEATKSSETKSTETDSSEASKASEEDSAGGTSDSEAAGGSTSSEAAEETTSSETSSKNSSESTEASNSSETKSSETETTETTESTETTVKAKDLAAAKAKEEANAAANKANVSTDANGEKVVDGSSLGLMYNAEKGSYEIVDMSQYLTSQLYESENDRLGVDDFSNYSGFTAEAKDSNPMKGIWLYILAALGICGLLYVGAGVYQKRKR